MKKINSYEKNGFFNKILLLFTVCVLLQPWLIEQSKAQITCRLSISCSFVNPTCYGDCDGSILDVVSGGSGSYSYLWSNGQTTNAISQLCAGTYTLTVTDLVTQCTKTRTTTLSKAKVGVTFVTTPAHCGLCNGTITATGKGGNGGPFTYLWSTGATTAQITGVCPNVNYTLTVTDKKGCTFICRKKTTNVGTTVSDNNICTTDACDPVTGQTIYTPVNTDDNDVCTTDGCDPVTGVYHNPVNSDDNDVCTTDGCDPVTGVYHNPVNSDDNNVCTTDGCDPVTGVYHNPVNSDDNTVCTTDGCDPVTGVYHNPVNSDDNNVCTADGCDPVTGVYHNPVNSDDNNVCTTDGCDPVTGVYHNPVNSDDNNPCTTDGCDPVTGVYHTPNNTCCNGNFLTYTQGGWHNTGTPGTYLTNHFDACLDTFVLGDPCGKTIKFSDAAAIKTFLPQGSTAAALTQNLINPGSANITVLAGQVLSNGLALLFDNCDPNFGGSTSSLGAQIYNVNGSPFKGWSIQAIYDTARKVLSGCPSNYTPAQMNVVSTAINENYDAGGNQNHFNCPSSLSRLSGGVDNSAKYVNARPNPFSHSLTLEVTSDEYLIVTVTDITGRLFGEYKNVNQSIEMNNDWNNGMYFITVKNESGSYQQVLKVIRVE